MMRFDVQHQDCFDSLAAMRDAGGARLIVGSGTVAFSCHRHGRRFVGGDLGHRKRDGRRWADIVNDGLRQTTLFDNIPAERMAQQ